MTAMVDAPERAIPGTSFRKVLGKIAEGMSIRGACNYLRKQGIKVPSAARFVRWVMHKPERWQRYTRAQVAASELLADEMDRLAERAGDGVTDPGMLGAQIRKAELRINTRKWTLAKRSPARFGDRLQHEHSGSISVTVDSGLRDDAPRIGVELVDAVTGPSTDMLALLDDELHASVAQAPALADGLAMLD